MSGKQELPSSPEEFEALFAGINKHLNIGTQAEESGAEPDTTAQAEIKEQIGYEIHPQYGFELYTLQKDILSCIENSGPFTTDSDGLDVDNMDLRKRAYSQNAPVFSKELPLKPLFVEFIHYPDPYANPLSQAVNRPIRTQLNLGLHTDYATSPDANLLQAEKGFPNRFDPLVTYATDEHTKDLIKVCRIPHEFEDERTDILPSEPDGQYVLSDVREIDIHLMTAYLRALRTELRESR